MRFLFFSIVFGNLLFASTLQEPTLLQKINRQKPTVETERIERIGTALPNIKDIEALLKKYGKEDKENFAQSLSSQKGVRVSRTSSTISIQETPTGSRPSVQIYQAPQPHQNKASQTEQQTIRLMGYCFFDRDIEVFGFEKMYATLPCSFEGINQLAQVMGELIPKPQSYTLVFKPIEVYIGNRIYKVKGGYALSGDRSSINVASEVNPQAVKKILASAGADASQQASDMIQNAVKSAQTQVSVNGDVVVKKTEFDIDVLGEGVLWAGIASLISNTAQYFKNQAEKIPVTFRIYKGSRIWLNIDVAYKGIIP